MEGIHIDQCIKIIVVYGGLYHILESLATSIRQRDMNEMCISLLSQWWSDSTLDLFNLLFLHFNLIFDFFLLFLNSSLFLYFLHKFIILFLRVVLQVALQVVRVHVLLFVYFVDIVRIKIHVLHTFEIQLGKEELFIT